MSTYKVPLTTIREVLPHPNADRLDIVKCYDWMVVTQKGKMKVGDMVIYIPVDSIMPGDLETYLFPPDSKIKLNKSRVRSIKIRGHISQGMVIRPEELPAEIMTLPKKEWKEDVDVAEVLKLTKYEPPVDHIQNSGQAKKVRKDNPNFHKYTSLENFKWYDRIFQDGELVYVSSKLHGCLKSNTPILMADGSTKYIGDIVREKCTDPVLGTDAAGNLVVSKIINHFNNGSTSKWLKIKIAARTRGSYYKVVNTTPNHKFYDPIKNNYVAAEDIKIGQPLWILNDTFKITYTQEQTLIGKMLGDGSYDVMHRHMNFGHKKEHQEYMDHTLRYLSYLAGNKQKNVVSGYGTEMCRARTISSHSIDKMFCDWFSTDGKKLVPKSAIKKIGPIALAFWYMDDGSLSHNESQRDRACFATCAFDEQSIDNLIAAFAKFDINAVKYYADEYWRLRLNTEAAYKFFTIITPYVPEIMQYKLPEEFRGQKDVHLPRLEQSKEFIPIETKVLEVEELYEHNNRYDIETETHNFFANGILVHNSNFRAGWFKNEPTTLWKKIKKFFGFLPEWEFCWGSHNVQIQCKVYHRGYYSEDVYTKMVKQYNLKEAIPKGMAVYGEIVGSGIQKNYTYGCGEGEHKLYVFDVMKDGEYLDYITEADSGIQSCARGDVAEEDLPISFKNAVHDMKLEAVPFLYCGPFSKAIVDQYRDGNDMGQVREGIVIKPVIESTCCVGRKVLKAISDAYYLTQDNTDFH